jgi:hypothetical protein
MAKRSIEPIRRCMLLKSIDDNYCYYLDSTSDAYLIALLSEPVKRRNIKVLTWWYFF